MDLARWSRRAEWAVAAAVFALHLWFLRPIPSGFAPPLVESLFADVLGLCYLALLVGWLIAGPGPAWLRGSAAGAIVAGWLLFAVRRFEVPVAMPDFGPPLYLAFVATIAAAMAMLRAFGLRVNRAAGGHGHAERPRLQFSIRALIIATTLIAAVIGLLEYLRPTIGAEEQLRVPILLGGEMRETWPTPGMVREVVLSLGLAAMALGAAAVVLRPGAIWLRLGILAVAIPTLAAYMMHLAGITNETLLQRIGELAASYTALAGLTAITLLPLRLFGYRLCRPAPAAVSLRETSPFRRTPAVMQSAAPIPETVP